MPKPKCPVCARVGKQIKPGEYRCSLGHLFDANPNEGGDYHADPSKRIERQDEIRVARRDNEARRDLARNGFRFGARR
jgi:hypothetical protein